MKDLLLALLVGCGVFGGVHLIIKLDQYIYKRLAKSWNDMRKANKINRKIEKELR